MSFYYFVRKREGENGPQDASSTEDVLVVIIMISDWQLSIYM